MLQVEHGQNPAPVRRLKVGPHILRLEDLHLLPLYFGDDAVLGGVAEDQPLLHRPVQGVVEHHVDAPDGGVAQSGLWFVTAE